MDYQEYLESEKWQKKRKRALKRANNRCQICYRRDRLEVHHRTYRRCQRERLSDLTVLCYCCHAFAHFITTIDPDAKMIAKLKQAKPTMKRLDYLDQLKRLDGNA